MWEPWIKEFWVIKEAEEAFGDIIQGFYVLYYTDHLNSLRVDTLPLQKLDPKLIRWWAYVKSRGERAICHVPGSAHCLPDGLSRNPKDRDALLEAKESWKADPQKFLHLFDPEAFNDISNILRDTYDPGPSRSGCGHCVLKDLEAGQIGFFVELWGGLARWTRCCGDQGAK